MFKHIQTDQTDPPNPYRPNPNSVIYKDFYFKCTSGWPQNSGHMNTYTYIYIPWWWHKCMGWYEPWQICTKGLNGEGEEGKKFHLKGATSWKWFHTTRDSLDCYHWQGLSCPKRQQITREIPSMAGIRNKHLQVSYDLKWRSVSGGVSTWHCCSWCHQPQVQTEKRVCFPTSGNLVLNQVTQQFWPSFPVSRIVARINFSSVNFPSKRNAVQFTRHQTNYPLPRNENIL